MHSTTVPVRAGVQPEYGDVVAEVSAHLLDVAASARSGGSTEVWIDPGTGFGKGVEDNLRLLRRLPELCGPGAPVLLGVSGKSFLGAVTGRDVETDWPVRWPWSPRRGRPASTSSGYTTCGNAGRDCDARGRLGPTGLVAACRAGEDVDLLSRTGCHDSGQ
ncbi:dihydropteroate synthase [Amycolatopsis sp. NBC_01286]|uniref:dihydropteroate synthase n=1 Tax=Amycolatopsis sp. NBC_01286 TaxID=2903560 RepID=UPI002E0EE0FA|nr:dihydropteroate synthase [Amycolatopsis sp. NBC_01286]